MDRYDGLPNLRSSWTPQEISDALRPHIERLGFEDEHWPGGQSGEDHIVTAWHRISDVYSPYKVPKEGIAFTAADGSPIPIEGDTPISGMDGVSVWSHGDVNVGCRPPRSIPVAKHVALPGRVRRCDCRFHSAD